MSTFQVYDDLGTVLLETDDWVAAEAAASVNHWPRRFGGCLGIRGTHPSHDWYRPDEATPGNPDRTRRCRNCDGWDNGSYGSHAPCGYQWEGPGGSSLVAALEREMASRASAGTAEVKPQDLYEALQEIPRDESECPDCRGVGGNLQTGEHCATCLATGRDPADLAHLADGDA